MKTGDNFERLREDALALRFVNRQTGYGLDVRETLKRKYRFERIAGQNLS